MTMYTICVIVDLVNVETTVKVSLITEEQGVKQPWCSGVGYTCTAIPTSSSSTTTAKQQTYTYNCSKRIPSMGKEQEEKNLDKKQTKDHGAVSWRAENLHWASNSRWLVPDPCK